METANGRSYRVDAAVLALGNFVRRPRRQLPGYVGNPWSDAARHRSSPTGRSSCSAPA